MLSQLRWYVSAERQPAPVADREAVYYPPTDTTYRRAARGGDREIHLTRGTCDEFVQRGEGNPELCGFTSAYRKITDEGITDLCGLHAPDSWLEAEQDTDARSWDVISLYRIDDEVERDPEGCKKWVETPADRARREAEDARETPGKSEGYHRCADRPLIVFVNDGQVEEGFCGKHIRPTWLKELKV